MEYIHPLIGLADIIMQCFNTENTVGLLAVVSHWGSLLWGYLLLLLLLGEGVPANMDLAGGSFWVVSAAKGSLVAEVVTLESHCHPK